MINYTHYCLPYHINAFITYETGLWIFHIFDNNLEINPLMLIVAISGLTISIKSRKWKVLGKYLNEKCYLKHYQWLSFKYFEFFILNFEVIVKSNLDQDDKFKRYLNGSRMLLENVSIIYKNFMSCINSDQHFPFKSFPFTRNISQNCEAALGCFSHWWVNPDK